MRRKQIESMLFGLAIGDALGVPVEFMSRDEIRVEPVRDMLGYGTHHQAPGTFSDDSSLAFCLAEALCSTYHVNHLASNFIAWFDHAYWTAHGEVFDVGISTREAIFQLKSGVKSTQAGGATSHSNGNGSLMRIAPLLFYIHDMTINERFELTKEVSSVTHRHIRSVIACFYFLEFSRYLLLGKDKWEAFQLVQLELPQFLNSIDVSFYEINIFDRLLSNPIYELVESDILSSGYVVHTLEASIWCLLNTDNYSDAVLKAVNLGDDSDTTSAVTGALAGLLYGIDHIPPHWISQLARNKDIFELAKRMGEWYGEESNSL